MFTEVGFHVTRGYVINYVWYLLSYIINHDIVSNTVVENLHFHANA